VLTAAIGVIVVTALAAIVNGVMIATGGTELIKDILVDAGLSDAELEMAAQLGGYSTLDEFVDTFAMRGYLALGGGVALLVFGLLMRKAATWTRVLVTISAALTIVFSLIIVGDETTPTMAGLAMLAMLGGIVAIVLTWLPANGRYAKATA
jgi:hypothetical protein